MLFDRLIRRIGRTARGSAAKKHQVVYYDIRINNVEAVWSAVRIVWISGTGKQTRSDAVPVLESCAQLDGGVTVEHTLYKAQREFLPKTVHIAIDAQPAGADATTPFVRLASLYLDIGTMCNGSHKGIVVTDARPSRPGATAGKVYQVQMRIEVPGLAAEKMGGARGGSGLDHLTTVSSYQDSLMFTSAPADLAHGPDGKGPELEAVHLESMSNLSEGHMPRAHANDRHTGGDSTGDLALAHYDERQGQSSMLSENTDGAQRRLERRNSAHSSLTSEDLDDYDPADTAADGSKGASPSSGGTVTTPSSQHGAPNPGLLASPGQRLAVSMSGMPSSASEALEPVVEDPMDTAGAVSGDGAHDSPSGMEVQQEPPDGRDDWEDGEHSASMPLEDEMVGAESSSLEDSHSVPLAAQHGRHSSAAAGAAGQRQTLLRSKGVSSDSRGVGAVEHRAPGSLRKPTAAPTARRKAANLATMTPKSRTAQPSAAAYRSRPSLAGASAGGTPARSTSTRASSAACSRHSYPMQTPRNPATSRAPGWTPSSSGRPRRSTAALRQSMEDAAKPSPIRKAPLDTGLPLKQKMIVRRDPLLYRKGQQGTLGGGGRGQGLGERRERRLQTVPSTNSRDDSSSLAATSSGRSDAVFELALDVHKRKAVGAAPAAGQAKWVSKATVARRQQRQQHTDHRKSIAPGTPAFGTSVPALRSPGPSKRSPGPGPAPNSSVGSGTSSTTKKSLASRKSPPTTRTFTAHTNSHLQTTAAAPAVAALQVPEPRRAEDGGASTSPPESLQGSAVKASPASPVNVPLRSASTSPVRSPTKSPGKSPRRLPTMTSASSPTKSPTKTPTKLPVATSPLKRQLSPGQDAVQSGGLNGAPHADIASKPVCPAVQIGPRTNLTTASADTLADAASKESPTCRTEVSSLSAVPQTLTTGHSGVSPTRSQAGVSELSLDEPDTNNPIDLVGDLTPANVSAQIVSARIGSADMHDLPERQAAATFIKELTSHSSVHHATEVRGSMDSHAHAAGEAYRQHTAAMAPHPNGRSGLEPGGGNSRLSSVSHISGGPLSALDAVESGSSSISMSCQMGPTASRASSDYAGTEYAATGPFVDSIVDGQVLGWMNATSATYYQPE